MNAAVPVSLEKLSTEYRELRLDEIAADIHQDRREFDSEELQGLADSIAEDGVQQPIIVRVNADGQGIGGDRDDASSQFPIAARYTIIAGERRWRASKIAGKTTIPALIRFGLNADDVIVIQAIENLQRTDLKLPEQAGACVRLVQRLGLDQAAKRLAKSKSWVSLRSSVIGMPAEIRELVQSGVIKDVQIAHKLHELSKLCEADPNDAEFYHDVLGDFTAPGERGMPARDDMDTYLAETREAHQNRARAREGRESQKSGEESGTAAPPASDAAGPPAVPAESRFDIRRKKIEAINRQLDAYTPRARLQLSEALGATLPKRMDTLGWDNNLPVRAIGKAQLTPYDGDPIPDTIAGADVRVHINGTAALFEPLWQYLSFGLSVHLEGLSVEQAASIQRIVGPDQTFGTVVQLKVDSLDLLISNLQTRPKAADKASFTKADAVHLAKWVKKNVRKKAGSRLKAGDVHAAYCVDCELQSLLPITINSTDWGDAIRNAGIEKLRSGGIQYIDVGFTK